MAVNFAIEVDDLSYTYPDGKTALRDVSIRIPEGEFLGVIGPNGSGKSTLLLHLNGILPASLPASPAVKVFGELVTKQSVHSVRRSVGLLFQDPDDQLFCPTVGEDVSFGPQQLGLPDDEVRRRVESALRDVGLAGYEDRQPHHLSWGERQRACLAGLLACSPKILVLDEPTNGLDPRGKRELVTLLRTLPGTKIIATHDLELVVRLCTRTIVLDAGVVVAEGPPAELLSDEDLMLAHGLEKPHILQHRHPHS
jgi:cobalt/nickel transport system ATP-binding protein